MSADIWLEDEHGTKLEWNYQHSAVQNIANVSYGNNFNLTYNLSPMLWEAGMPTWKDFIGTPAHAAGLKWMNVIAELQAHPGKYRALNPANGWGCYEDALEVLTALVNACRAHPDAKIGGWL